MEAEGGGLRQCPEAGLKRPYPATPYCQRKKSWVRFFLFLLDLYRLLGMPTSQVPSGPIDQERRCL